jgi:N-acetylglucosamine-6-phosphate deacetylase
MRALHHREPGPALALLEDPRVIVELIADGIHIHPAVLHTTVRVAGAERVALVTDATTAAGAEDGEYQLGAVSVDVVEGVARVRGTSTIAGSTATMDQLFGAAAGLGSDRDAALIAAVLLTSTTPARALGIDGSGALRVGGDANLVVLNQDSTVHAVMAGGSWVAGR